MHMGNSPNSRGECRISMLWNWYTINTCFISRTWRNDTVAKFGGSCFGCFLLVFTAQWLNRVARQFDIELLRRHRLKHLARLQSERDVSSEEVKGSVDSDFPGYLCSLAKESDWKTTLMVIGKTMSHKWYTNFVGRQYETELERQLLDGSLGLSSDIYPTLLDHVIRASIFTVQWTLSYFIMMLFMYYNGYIIICCILGALFGRIFFNYEVLGTCGGTNITVAHDREVNDRKCCM